MTFMFYRYDVLQKQDIKGKTELLETMKTNLTTLMTLQQSIISKHDDDSKFIRKTQTELDNAEQVRMENRLFFWGFQF